MAKKSYPTESDWSALDAYTVKELFSLVRDNPNLGFTMKRVRREEGWQSWFYALDCYGRKSRISREEAADRYVTLRMKRAEEVNELARGKELPRGTAWKPIQEGLPSFEDEPAEEKLREVYQVLGITQKHNGEGKNFVQDKRNNFQKGNSHTQENRCSPQPVSRQYVLDAIAAYALYETLIKSNHFEDVERATRLAEQYFPRPIVHEAQRKLFHVYGDPKDVSRLYQNEVGIASIDYRNNPHHASSDLERELEIEKLTEPLSIVEAAEFEREVRTKNLERLVEAEAGV